MVVYGSDICIDCRNFRHINAARNLGLEFIDITENTDNLRAFLKLRDTEDVYAPLREGGGIGIPVFVEGERVTLDINEAFSWIGQPPVEQWEIAESGEVFDVCDEEGNPLGETVPRERAHREGICHRTAHVWIARKKEGRWQVLLQKRSMGKESFPGCLDTSSAGHVPAGEEPVQAALRELQEELGICVSEEDLHFAGKFRVQYEETFHGRAFQDNEVANVFVCVKPLEIASVRVQKEEVESVGWFDYEETVRACRREDPAYCVPVKGLETAGAWLNGMDENG